MKAAVVVPASNGRGSPPRFGAAPVALGLILLLALGLRIYHLGSRPLYQDESYHTAMVATQPLSYITATNFGSTFYAVLVHFLLPLGQPEMMARLPAALFGLLSVWAIFLLGKKVFGKSEALLAALLLAVSVFAIYYSQQARGYSGLLFFSIVSLYFFWRSVYEKKSSLWIPYVLSTVAGIYTHIFFMIIVPVQAAFAVLLLLEQRLRKEPTDFPAIRRTAWGFALSFFSIFILTYLLYLPTKTTLYLPARAVESINLFDLFKSSLAGLFQARLALGFGGVFTEILKKLLSYDVLPWFFYLQSGLVLVGIAAAIKKQGRALVLFGLYLSLPFLLFSLSNPPAVYQLPSPAKFGFLLPLLFLLLAKGLIGLHHILTAAGSKLTRTGNTKVLRNALWVPMIMGLLIGQGAIIDNHYFYNWNYLSLKMDRETRTHLRQAVSQTEFLYSDESPNKNAFLILEPLVYPDGHKKGVAVFESDYDYIFAGHLDRPTGLWVILNRSSFAEEDIPLLKAVSAAAEIRPLARDLVVHFPPGEGTLYDKYVSLLNVLLNRPAGGEKTSEYRLILAKVHLLANRYPEALRELEAWHLTSSRPSPGTGLKQPTATAREKGGRLLRPERERLSLLVQATLAEGLHQHLTKKADQLLFDGRFNAALNLQKEAERLHDDPPRSALWGHLSAAESCLERGLPDNAVREYKQCLPLCQTPRYESYVMKKILENQDLPYGYLIWRRKDVCQIRWWSRTERTFMGSVESSRPFRILGAPHLASGKDYRFSRRKAVFRAVVGEDKLPGLAFSIKSRSRLTLRLEIKGRGDIKDHIILLPEDTQPREMPFSIEAL